MGADLSTAAVCLRTTTGSENGSRIRAAALTGAPTENIKLVWVDELVINLSFDPDAGDTAAAAPSECKEIEG
jgi:hypothetical protein